MISTTSHPALEWACQQVPHLSCLAGTHPLQTRASCACHLLRRLTHIFITLQFPFDISEYMLHISEQTLLTCSPACCMPAADSWEVNGNSRHGCNYSKHPFKIPCNEGYEIHFRPTPLLQPQGNGTIVTSLQSHIATLTHGAVCPQGKQAARASTAGRHSGLATPVSRLPPCCEDHPCRTCCSCAAACTAQYDLLHAFLLDSLSHGGQNPGIHHCICSLLFSGCFCF